MIGDHLRLGGYFAAASVVFYVADNMDRVLVGRLVGPEAVGLYGQAYNIMIKPVYVVITPLVALVLTSLSRAAEQPATREQLVVAYYRLLAVLLAAGGGGTGGGGQRRDAALGRSGVERLRGRCLSVLAIGMFGQALVILGVPILTAADRGGRLLGGGGRGGHRARHRVFGRLVVRREVWRAGARRGVRLCDRGAGGDCGAVHVVLPADGRVSRRRGIRGPRAAGTRGGCDGRRRVARGPMAANRVAAAAIGGVGAARCAGLRGAARARSCGSSNSRSSS